MNEYDILQFDIGGVTIKEAGAFTYLQWIANKINGVQAFSADSIELTALVQSPPMSRFMNNERKIELFRKLERLNIQLP